MASLLIGNDAAAVLYLQWVNEKAPHLFFEGVKWNGQSFLSVGEAIFERAELSTLPGIGW